MTNIRAIGNKVLGKMIEPVGRDRKTAAGIIITENNMSESAIRSRWFHVTSVGPTQTSVKEGQYVLVAHGRWSHGINLENTYREEDKIFRIDPDEMLLVSDENPF
jgi:co-chaperonin GroES (HSP10)